MGWMDKYKDGGKKKFLEPNDKKLPIGYDEDIPNVFEPHSELASSIGGEYGEPAYLIPTFKYGHPLDNPLQEYKESGEHLGGPFKTWQEADEWDKNVRHPYVEKGQSLPSPLKRWGKDYQNGGEINLPEFNMVATQPINYMQGVPLQPFNILDAIPTHLQHLPQRQHTQEEIDAMLSTHHDVIKHLSPLNGTKGNYSAGTFGGGSMNTTGSGHINACSGNKGFGNSGACSIESKENGGWLNKYKNSGRIAQNGLSKPSIISPEDKFYDYLKFNEGVKYKPYKDRKSREAKETVGVGHKISPEERKSGMIYGVPYKKGISDEQSDNILQKDIDDKKNTLNNYLQKNHNITLDELSPTKQYALLDMEFNTGSAGKEFPKFTKAVIEGDYNTQAQEYKRTMKVNGKQVPLKQRNATFNKEYVIPMMSEDIVNERLKSGKLKFTPDEESIAQRAKDIVEKRKEGGIIKDNMGYWNPNNFGKVVEIGSPNITMEGVREPLIGISDIGEKKMMLPENNYKFAGTKVTEYPLSKNGTELQKLDQLTNFTNYNKPSKYWLRKYENG